MLNCDFEHSNILLCWYDSCRSLESCLWIFSFNYKFDLCRLIGWVYDNSSSSSKYCL